MCASRYVYVSIRPSSDIRAGNLSDGPRLIAATAVLRRISMSGRNGSRGVIWHSNLRRTLATSATDNRSGSSTVCFTNGPGCLIHSVYLEKSCFQELLGLGKHLDVAQRMANHESARTTGLYDRRMGEVVLDHL